MKRGVERIGIFFAKELVDKFIDKTRLIGRMLSIKVLVENAIILVILVFALCCGIKR